MNVESCQDLEFKLMKTLENYELFSTMEALPNWIENLELSKISVSAATFDLLGARAEILTKIFVGFLVNLKTPKVLFEINWPLVCEYISAYVGT